MQIDSAELGKVPYLDRDVIGSRLVSPLPFWDGASWHVWNPGKHGLMCLTAVEAIHADYVSKEAARDSDLWVPFVDLMWQRASWPDVYPIITAIRDDFHNLSTSVAKLRHFHRTRAMLNTRITWFAATEIEYITTVARGVFDLLQEAIALIWDGRIHLLDEAAEKRRRGRKLPSTFSKVVLQEKKSPRTAEEISNKFCVPPKLAAEYEKHADFFCQLRNVRDKVVHGVGSLPTVFSTEKGFCINPKLPPFESFAVWGDQHRYNDNIVSLLPWLAHVVLHTVDACSALMTAFASQIEFPPEIAPGYRVFVRGVNSDVIGDLIRCHRGEMVWWEAGDT